MVEGALIDIVHQHLLVMLLVCIVDKLAESDHSMDALSNNG